MTADGSIDCQCKYNGKSTGSQYGRRNSTFVNPWLLSQLILMLCYILGTPAIQERRVANLHLAEIITAIHALRDGGHFVLKMFTFFEGETVCSLYLLSHMFREIHVFKPGTSKEGNSEVYVICKDFSSHAFTNEMSQVLRTNHENMTGKTLFSKTDIDSKFMEEIRRCATFFKGMQTNVIMRNIKTFQKNRVFPSQWRGKFGEVAQGEFDEVALEETVPLNMKSQKSDVIFSDGDMRKLRTAVAKDFISRYDIRPIHDNQKLLPVANTYRCKVPSPILVNSIRGCLQMDEKSETADTFNSQVSSTPNKLSFTKRWHQVKEKVLQIRIPKKPRRVEVCTLEASLELKPLFGKPYDKIRSSKFCPSSIIAVLDELYDLIKELNYKQNIPCIKCSSNDSSSGFFSLDSSSDSGSDLGGEFDGTKRIRLDFETDDGGKQTPKSTICRCACSPSIYNGNDCISLNPVFCQMADQVLECETTGHTAGSPEKTSIGEICKILLRFSPNIASNTGILAFHAKGDEEAAKESPGGGGGDTSYLQRYLDICANSEAIESFVNGCLVAVQKAERSSNLLIVNFPLLTRVYVGVLYVLGIFKYYRLMKNKEDKIIMCEYHAVEP